MNCCSYMCAIVVRFLQAGHPLLTYALLTPFLFPTVSIHPYIFFLNLTAHRFPLPSLPVISLPELRPLLWLPYRSSGRNCIHST